jgi:hypothetical protein
MTSLSASDEAFERSCTAGGCSFLQGIAHWIRNRNIRFTPESRY